MQKNRTIPVVLGILVIGIAAIFALIQPRIISSTPVLTPTISNSPASAPADVGGYTLAQVAVHSDATSCWSAINGSVYDLTSWIAQHPGGEGTILGICGKDGSAAFNNQHRSQRRPESILSNYKIGALK